LQYFGKRIQDRFCKRWNSLQVNFSSNCSMRLQRAFFFFLPLSTSSRLCASRRPVRRLLRGAYEFCRWISLPNGR
jgi:hypothetical protein